MNFIGIDPGTDTGFAIWCSRTKQLTHVETCKIHEAMAMVQNADISKQLRMVVFEDARLRTWFGSAGREKLQGVGSVKRDCAIWADFLGDMGVPYLAIKPQAGATKWTAEQFAKRTGWTKRTSEHGRDAALLVWGR